VWYWVWVYCFIADSPNGIIRVVLNNDEEIATLTSIDTRNDSGTSGNTASFITTGLNTNYHLDDMYVIDATGTGDDGDDASPGEVTIPFLYPNAAGDTTGLSTQGSGTNYLNVDEIPPNTTDYNYSSTPGTLDLYGVTNLSGATSVKGVVTRAKDQKSAASALSARQILKTNASVSNGTDHSLSTSWVSRMRCLRENPVTATDWTTGEVDALQVGWEVRT
jgi:hypothetical protein